MCLATLLNQWNVRGAENGVFQRGLMEIEVSAYTITLNADEFARDQHAMAMVWIGRSKRVHR